MIGADCCDTDCEYLVVGIPGPPGPPGGGGGGPAEDLRITGTAAVPLGGHRAVYRRADGLIDYADAATLSHMSRAIGITTAAAAAGGAVTIVMLGEMTEGSWTWTPGGAIFLGLNGVLTQNVPALPGSAFQAVLGVAVTSTTMYVDRQPSIDLS